MLKYKQQQKCGELAALSDSRLCDVYFTLCNVCWCAKCRSCGDGKFHLSF